MRFRKDADSKRKAVVNEACVGPGVQTAIDQELLKCAQETKCAYLTSVDESGVA